ncbi:proteinase-activated receptor 4-like [Engraulis encrasicolus]|uniref:proteinase-activated receptor 4-like n=1 Tax=Engraulis encrasicolus TaxID=184585 RepID=UPI002FD487C6
MADMALCWSLQAPLLLLFSSAFRLTSSSLEEPRDPWVSAQNCSMEQIATENMKSGTMTVLLPSLYLVALVLGLPSNLLALWVLLFRTKKQPSTILLINLTTCDLLLLAVLPFRIAYHFQGNNWTLGEPFCRLVMALFYGNMYGSMLCLALIAFDRYLALVHPLRALTLRGLHHTVPMSVAVWVVVLAAMAPLLATQQTHPIKNRNITTCHDVLPLDKQPNFFLPYFVSLFCICFVPSFLVVVFCYGCVLRKNTDNRFRYAVHATVLVMGVCLVCLLPSNVLMILRNINWLEVVEGWSQVIHLHMAYMLALALSAFNSCLNPLNLYYLSTDFQKKMQQAMCHRDLSQCSTLRPNNKRLSLMPT